jgi:hypothetical protein
MDQQWKDVLATQIVEHMYKDEDEDWFINMLVQENANIAIAKHEHPIHGDLEDLQICLEISNFGMIGFMSTTFMKTLCMIGDYLEGDKR